MKKSLLLRFLALVLFTALLPAAPAGVFAAAEEFSSGKTY